MSYAEKVQAGVAYLNEQRPGWYLSVNLGKLDLGEECHCVLGQLGGNFFKMLEKLRLPEKQAIDFGFLLEWRGVPPEVVTREYDLLTEEWVTVIAQFQKG